MDFNHLIVKSMGFENYTINYAINILENGQLYDGYKFEDERHFVSVTKTDKHHTIFVRAYIDGIGWQTTEVVL